MTYHETPIENISSAYEMMLKECGIYDMYRLMKLYYDWPQVVGSQVANHAKLVDIQSSCIVVEIAHTVWMQEMTMRKHQIIEAINNYYGFSQIKDMKVQLPRHAIFQEPKKSDMLDISPMDNERIDFQNIRLSDDQIAAIQDSVGVIQDGELRKKLFTVRIEQAKKEKLLQESNFHRCPSCGVWQGYEGICQQCEYKSYRKAIHYVKYLLTLYPHYKFDQICEVYPSCTYDWYAVAKRESIYFYLDKLYKGSTDPNDMYWAVMLICSKPQDELTYTEVVNITNKYRKLDSQKMQVKTGD